MLKKYYNFAPGSIKLILGPQATASNIEYWFREWLIKGTQAGDRVFFFYAGHGAQADDDGNDEKDKKDEVLAPYDVQVASPDIPTGKFIRDDSLNDWLAEIYNRRVVMAFDSCHSGTISRGAGNKAPVNSRHLRLKTPPVSRGPGDVYSLVPSTGRDLGIVRDDAAFELLNGAVIFSAASPYQEAQPIVRNGEMRGAFSYLLESVLSQNSKMAVGQIARSLTTQMAALDDLPVGRNGEKQVPQVETKGQAGINNLPLWADTGVAPDYTASPLVALHNPLSSMQVTLTMLNPQGRPQSSSPPPVYYYDPKNNNDDLFNYEVSVADKDGNTAPVYLYVLIFSKDNVAACVFPTANGGDTENRIASGKHRFPRSEKYETYADKPAGFDIWVALASREKLPLGEKQDYTWGEVFDKLNIKELQTAVAKAGQAMRGGGNRKKLESNDWQAATFVVETRERGVSKLLNNQRTTTAAFAHRRAKAKSKPKAKPVSRRRR